MKSTTSCSLFPAFSCSRIWFLRSTASGAFESASVWFWHTRQRSSTASAVTRFSISSSCARTPRGAANASNSSSLVTRAQLLHQRLELLARDLGREGSDVLVADNTPLVDDVGFGHAIDAVVDRDPASGVVHREPIRIAVALEPGQRVLARVLVVKPDHRDSLRELGDDRVLDETRRAPRRPHVQHPH